MSGGILGRWHAEPLSRTEAAKLLQEAERRRRRGRGAPCRVCGLLELIARFWLDQPTAALYQDLCIRLRRTARGRAVLELIQGQLLASRRMAGAFDYLDAGFEQAHHLFTATDYLAVMNRHHRLRALPLSPQPLPPESLDGLLALTVVISQLGVEHPRAPHDPTDIYG